MAGVQLQRPWGRAGRVLQPVLPQGSLTPPWPQGAGCHLLPVLSMVWVGSMASPWPPQLRPLCQPPPTPPAFGALLALLPTNIRLCLPTPVPLHGLLSCP
ncbi:unnamed protein product [Rangifer tarandus platyrhynchus]|uniref:Uncharacterized protein n=2 Tax=Rangifer tarandus platyrhynchus TaxID=3082113 RepID=A0ABN8Z804_RANTA|nr:unnamed protein product [Rangifer tarandus platyrhynchus]